MLVRIAHIKHGTFAGRALSDVRFMLIEKVTNGLRGPFLKVTGVGVMGFPQRNIKIYVDDEATDVDYIDVEQSEAKHILGNFGKDECSSDSAEQPLTDLTYNMIAEESIDDIRKRMIERFLVLSEMSVAAAQGTIRGLLVSGPPGVGKSYEVEQAMTIAKAISADEFDRLKRLKASLTARENDIDYVEEDNDLEIDACSIDDVKACFDINPLTGEETIKKQVFHIHKGFVRASGLYAYLYEHRHSHNVLIFDDTRTVLDEDDCADLLKSALDTTKKRIISWTVSGRRDGLPLSFVFDASIIFISNDDFDSMLKTSSRTMPHLEAILDRCLSIDVMLKTAKEKLVRIDYVSRDKGMIESRLREGVNPIDVDELENVREELLAWVHKHYQKFGNLSLRKILHLADLYKSGPHWERFAEITLLKNVR
jgi:hypothetical protein